MKHCNTGQSKVVDIVIQNITIKNMRNIINISLPEKMSKMVDKEVKQGGFSTKSEFFRHLIRIWEEQKLLDELQESRKEIAAGKGKVLKSFKDLR